jgi:hypothetical protein
MALPPTLTRRELAALHAYGKRRSGGVRALLRLVLGLIGRRPAAS